MRSRKFKTYKKKVETFLTEIPPFTEDPLGRPSLIMKKPDGQNVIFRNPTNLESNTITNNSTGEKLFVCKECFDLATHFHPDIFDPENVNCELNYRQLTGHDILAPPFTRKYFPFLDDFIFASGYLYIRHINEQHEPKCDSDECELKFSSWSDYEDHFPYCSRMTRQPTRGGWEHLVYLQDECETYENNWVKSGSVVCEYCQANLNYFNNSQKQSVRRRHNRICPGARQTRLFKRTNQQNSTKY